MFPCGQVFSKNMKGKGLSVRRMCNFRVSDSCRVWNWLS
uniref:Uncharacterized protein n=1 Tax=Arundo donax TaxID=35708 RepID=A0A0A9BMH0_ARUDO